MTARIILFAMPIETMDEEEQINFLSLLRKVFTFLAANQRPEK
ncbi:hypothetical protein [Paenibacillus sp. S-12]|nr:hypothetical protein [Paenibacillus sp. S-12]